MESKLAIFCRKMHNWIKIYLMVEFLCLNGKPNYHPNLVVNFRRSSDTILKLIAKLNLYSYRDSVNAFDFWSACSIGTV